MLDIETSISINSNGQLLYFQASIYIRALDKMGVFVDNFSYFSSNPYVVTPNLNRLDETAQMKGHHICYYAEITKITPNYHQILPLI